MTWLSNSFERMASKMRKGRVQASWSKGHGFKSDKRHFFFFCPLSLGRNNNIADSLLNWIPDWTAWSTTSLICVQKGNLNRNSFLRSVNRLIYTALLSQGPKINSYCNRPCLFTDRRWRNSFWLCNYICCPNSLICCYSNVQQIYAVKYRIKHEILSWEKMSMSKFDIGLGLADL